MKSLSKFAAVATGVMTLAIVSFAALPALADSTGQIEGGNIYQIENLTQKTNFANPASANSCDLLEYSARLHNIAYDEINNLNVTVSLPAAAGTSNTSTITTSASNAFPTTTSATTTLNLTSSQTVSYVSGTTELLDSNGNLITKLPDGITGSGVNVGNIDGSTTEYINFEAKVSCPSQPTQPSYSCNLLNVSTTADRQVNANVQYSAANGATFQSVSYNFGDNTTPLTTASTSATHSYANYGNYTVTASVLFSVNGSNQTSTNANCTKTVSFTAPTTPTTPTTLVNTGAGNVIGLFAAATVAGVFAHRLFLSRRLSRES
jgi:hypothetical protein